MIRPIPLLPALLLLLILPGAAQADDRYFMLIFGVQSTPDLARFSHTWGTFVKMTGEGPDLDRYKIADSLTISWLPVSLRVRLLEIRPQTGMNLDLHSTMHLYAYELPACITLWGPFEICPELYCKAGRRLNYLESGVPLFNAVDRARRPLVLDCIHALSGVDADPGALHTRSGYGNIASYFCVEHLSRWIIDCDRTHDSLIARLCLDRYPMERRGYGDAPFAILPILPPYYSHRPPLIPIRLRFRIPLEAFAQDELPILPVVPPAE